MPAHRKKNRAVGFGTFFTALGLIAVVAFRANFCYLDICSVKMQTAAETPACHESAQAAAHPQGQVQDVAAHSTPAEEPAPANLECCANVFATSVQNANGDWLAPIVQDFAPINSLFGAGGIHATAQITLTYLDRPPPPARAPLYLQHRSLLN